MFQRNPKNNVKVEQDAEKAKPFPELITKQVKDTAGIIASYLELKDLPSLSKTCKSTRAIFNNTLSVRTLLQAVVYGDYEKAKAMIQKNPQLLLERGTVKDYSGRVHSNRTAYQLALGACDYNVRDFAGKIVVDGMVEMIEEQFTKLLKKTEKEIQQIMQDQKSGQFPEDYDVLKDELMLKDSKAVNRIVQAIADVKDDKDCTVVSRLEDKLHNIKSNDKSALGDELRCITQSILHANSEKQFDEAFENLKKYLLVHELVIREMLNFDLLKSLYQFRNYLERKELFTIGNHFNHMLLVDAVSLYRSKFEQFGGNERSPKNVFNWCKVLGAIERHLPACDAQVIAQGGWSILQNSEKSNRSFRFPDFVGAYYPLEHASKLVIGHNCCISTESEKGYPAEVGFLHSTFDLSMLVLNKMVSAGDVGKLFLSSQKTESSKQVMRR